MMVNDMLHVLLECFTSLTERSDKVVPAVVSMITSFFFTHGYLSVTEVANYPVYCVFHSGSLCVGDNGVVGTDGSQTLPVAEALSHECGGCYRQ